MSQPGRLVRMLEGYYSAFIPNLLPQEFEWTPRIVHALSDADRAIGRLAGERGRTPTESSCAHAAVRRTRGGSVEAHRRDAGNAGRVTGCGRGLGELDSLFREWSRSPI